MSAAMARSSALNRAASGRWLGSREPMPARTASRATTPIGLLSHRAVSRPSQHVLHMATEVCACPSRSILSSSASRDIALSTSSAARPHRVCRSARRQGTVGRVRCSHSWPSSMANPFDPVVSPNCPAHLAAGYGREATLGGAVGWIVPVGRGFVDGWVVVGRRGKPPLPTLAGGLVAAAGGRCRFV